MFQLESVEQRSTLKGVRKNEVVMEVEGCWFCSYKKGHVQYGLTIFPTIYHIP